MAPLVFQHYSCCLLLLLLQDTPGNYDTDDDSQNIPEVQQFFTLPENIIIIDGDEDVVHAWPLFNSKLNLLDVIE